MRRIWLRGGVLLASSALLAGCAFGGLNSLSMPGTAGHGGGAYSITVELADVATLPQNSPVMVDDVTVGSVSGIAAEQRADGSFYAAVKLALDKNVVLPANSTAKVAQTSLLGSLHIELARTGRTKPAKGKPDRRVQNRRGQHRPLSRPPKRCSRRSAWWSTRAMSVRWKRSPMRRTRRWPAGRASSSTWCPGSRS